MKEGFVVKSGKAGEISPEELGKINRYCRRELTPGEVSGTPILVEGINRPEWLV